MDVVVDLHIWSLDVPSDRLDRALHSLSPDETARMERFVYDRHRHHYIAARGRLREILGAETGQAPESLVFTYGPEGKPSLQDGPSFNLSHSGGFACLAIHPTARLGVDIEAFRVVEEGVAARFFSDAENSALSSLKPSARKAAFFRCWTRKESIIKAIGGGLSIPLDAFDVTLSTEHPPQITRLDTPYGTASDWAMAHFAVGERIVGAVAALTGGAPLRLNLRTQPDDTLVIV